MFNRIIMSTAYSHTSSHSRRSEEMRALAAVVLCVLVAFSFVMTATCAASTSKSEADKLAADSRAALKLLYQTTPSAKVLGDKAKGILVFPSIVKGGFMIGGAYGEGTLFQNNRVVAYYRSTAASYGLQIGVQKFGYALFFMGDSDLAYLSKSDGWELGVGPTITIVDSGMAGSFSTTTARSGIYAFFFEQKGLMAGLGLQGTKLSKMHPD